MGDVINDKRENDKSAHHHVARSEGGFNMLLVDVGFGSSASIIDCEPDRVVNVHNDGREQKNSDYPMNRSEIAQMLRVTVDPIRAQKDLQISKQMSDDEKDQNDPGDRDDHFFSDRRMIKSRERVHEGLLLAVRFYSGNASQIDRQFVRRKCFA